MTGLLFDKTGSYQTVFIIAAALAATAVLCSSFIVERKHNPGYSTAEISPGPI